MSDEVKRPLKVFLCHAHDDKAKVRELYRYLRRRGIKPWFDEVDLVGGQDWQVEIPKALLTSDAIIICLTKNAVDKEGYIQKEIKFALDKALEMPEGRIFLIPIRFEECEVPFSLSRYQWVDLFNEAGYSRMMRALKFRASQLERATVELPKAAAAVAEGNLAVEASREKTKRESAEKAALEKAEREAAEQDAREKAEREVTEKVAREKAERETAEKALREKTKRESAEKAKREKAERRSAEITALKGTLSKVFVALKSTFHKTLPFLRIVGIIGIIIVLFWAGSWSIPKLIALVPTTMRTATTSAQKVPTVTFTALPLSTVQTQVPTTTFTDVPPSETPKPSLTLTEVYTPAITSTPLPEVYDPHPVADDYHDAFGVPMRLVPSGAFTMGRNADDALADCEKINKNNLYCSRDLFTDEEPMHQVILDAFYIDKYEVTNAIYKVCVDAGVCLKPHNTVSYDIPKNANYPVFYVDWNQANAYCEWRGTRLPTEAEWEKSARGTDKRTYPWGEGIDCRKANGGNTACAGSTKAIGSYESGRSPYGVYDLAGNVEEWVADWYSPKYYETLGQSGFNPLGPSTGQSRVLRGGSWTDRQNFLSVSNRHHSSPDYINYDLGFRCARSVP